MNVDIANFVVSKAIKLGADYADARLESAKGEAYILKNQTLEGAAFDEGSALGVRLRIKKGMSFFSTNVLNKKTIIKLIEENIKTAKAASTLNKKLIKLAPAPIYKKKYNIKPKVSFENVSPEEKIKLLLDLQKSLANAKATVVSNYFSVGIGSSSHYFVNSEGSRIFSTIPRVAFMYLFTVKEGNETAQRYMDLKQVGGMESFQKWNLSKVLPTEAEGVAFNLRKGVKPPRSKVDLVLAPEIAGIAAHESCGHPYEADRILGREAAQAGESFVTPNMLGTRIGSPVVTLVDDPTIPQSGGFYLYDDEGVKARRKYLIKNGVINEFLHNRETAAVLGTKSNGSARAMSPANEPIVRMSNTYFLPGSYSVEELFEGIKKGVYIKSYMEWNIDDKRLNQKYVGSEAFLIKNGKLCEPVKKPVLEITTPHFYQAIDAVAKDLSFIGGTCGKGEPMQGVPVWMGGPHIRLRGIKLAWT